MRLFVIFATLLATLPGQALAQSLVCAEDAKTFAQTCFAANGVRQNGNVRAAALYRGGPKDISDTGYTARVHCVSGVLELTDRQGVAFGRNRPEEQAGKDFVRFLCAHTKTKPDTKLKTN